MLAGISTALISFMTSTLPGLFVYFDFAVKRRLTRGSTVPCQRSNLEFISTHKFQLKPLMLRPHEEFDPQIKVNGVCDVSSSLPSFVIYLELLF